MLKNGLYKKNNDRPYPFFISNISNLSYKVGSCKHDKNPGGRIKDLLPTISRIKIELENIQALQIYYIIKFILIKY